MDQVPAEDAEDETVLIRDTRQVLRFVWNHPGNKGQRGQARIAPNPAFFRLASPVFLRAEALRVDVLPARGWREGARFRTTMAETPCRSGWKPQVSRSVPSPMRFGGMEPPCA